MKHQTRSKSNYLSHSILDKYFVQCVGICVPERKRTEGMQETQQYNLAMWWPPLHNLRHLLLSTTSTDYCCAVQQKSFIQHKAKHKPPASTNTVFTTKRQAFIMKMQPRNTGDIIKKTASEQNICWLLKLHTLTPTPITEPEWANFFFFTYNKQGTVWLNTVLICGSENLGVRLTCNARVSLWNHHLVWLWKAEELQRSLYHIPASDWNVRTPFGL